MKNIFMSDDGTVGFDTETQAIFRPDIEPDRVSQTILIHEPTKVTWQNLDGSEYSVMADEGDIIVKFYTGDYRYRIVVVKCAAWYINVLERRAADQEAKERWAAEKQQEELAPAELEQSRPIVKKARKNGKKDKENSKASI